MRRFLLPLLALGVLSAAAVPVSVAQQEDQPSRCPAGTVADADRGGRVVLTRRPRPRGYWACLRGRRPALIELYGYDTGLARIRLTSPYVAYEQTITSTGGDDTSLVLFDVRRERSHEGSVDGQVTDLELSRRGVAVARESGADGRPARVTRLDATGAESTLDRGAIAAGSLAISRDGRTAYWMRDGVARSASL